MSRFRVIRSSVPRYDRARHELRPEVVSQLPHQRLNFLIGHLQENLSFRTAAKAGQPRPLERLPIDQHARAEAESAQLPARLTVDHPANGERAIAEQNVLANLYPQLGQQLGPDERPSPLEQRMGVRLFTLQHHVTVEREVRLDTSQLHDLGDDPGRVGWPGHGDGLDGFGLPEQRNGFQGFRDDRPRFLGPGLLGLNQHVGSGQRLGFGGEGNANALNHRTQRHDGADPDRDTHEEEGKAFPRRAQLARHHAEDEHHEITAPLALPVPTWFAWPSRIESVSSACAAISGSCVTSTTVVPRSRFTSRSRSTT